MIVFLTEDDKVEGVAENAQGAENREDDPVREASNGLKPIMTKSTVGFHGHLSPLARIRPHQHSLPKNTSELMKVGEGETSFGVCMCCLETANASLLCQCGIHHHPFWDGI